MTFDPKDFKSATCERCRQVWPQNSLYLCEWNFFMKFLCRDCIAEIKEGFENNESEKCVHCGKSLKDMTILDGLHYHPRGSYCSKECYDAGCKTKKES